jgi:hypothetical protein
MQAIFQTPRHSQLDDNLLLLQSVGDRTGEARKIGRERKLKNFALFAQKLDPLRTSSEEMGNKVSVGAPG